MYSNQLYKTQEPLIFYDVHYDIFPPCNPFAHRLIILHLVLRQFLVYKCPNPFQRIPDRRNTLQRKLMEDARRPGVVKGSLLIDRLRQKPLSQTIRQRPSDLLA